MELEQLAKSLAAEELSGSDGVLRDARAVANRLYDFIFEPFFAKEPTRNRKVVNISHLADADGFGAQFQHKTLEMIVKLISESQYANFRAENITRVKKANLKGRITFVHEQLMSFSDHDDEKNSYDALMRHHGKGSSIFYQVSDMGSADLEQITEKFEQGVVIDHHEPQGELGPNFSELNPHRQGLGGDTLSGAGGTYIVLDMIIERLLHEQRFSLPTTVKRQVKTKMKSLREQALILALAGSSADQIGNEGINKLLYERANQFKLLELIPMGGYGHKSKPIMKMLAESSIPFNLKYANLRRKDFHQAVAKTIRGKNSLSPAEQKIADKLYYDHRDLFVLQYNNSKNPESNGLPGSGLNRRQLFINKMNAQLLSEEEIAKINGIFIQLGINDEVLKREEITVDGTTALSVRVNEEGTKIKESEFDYFDDDVYSTDTRYKIAAMTLFSALRAKADEEWKAGGGYQNLPNLFTTDKIEIKAFPHKRVDQLSEDEIGLFLRYWQENVRTFADPFNREQFVAELKVDNFATRHKKSIDPLLFGKTINEIGSYMTSVSKTGFRQSMVDALFSNGKEKEEGLYRVHRANLLYRQIIFNGMRRAEREMRTNQDFLQEIKPRVYLINFDFLAGVIKEVVENQKFNSESFSKEDFGKLDLRTLVGVFAGILGNTRKLPGHYALIFAGTKDYDMLRRGVRGDKVSGRMPEYAEEVFPGLHLGNDLMCYFGGGGHPGAASARIPEEKKPEFLDRLSSIAVEDFRYKKLLHSVGRSTFRRPFELTEKVKKKKNPRRTALDKKIEYLLKERNKTLVIKDASWGGNAFDFQPARGGAAPEVLATYQNGIIIPIDYLDPQLIFKRRELDNIGIPDLLHVSLGEDGKAYVRALDVKGESRFSEESRNKMLISGAQVSAWNTYNLISRHNLFEKAIQTAAAELGAEKIIFEDGAFITTETMHASNELSDYLKATGMITRRKSLIIDKSGARIARVQRKRQGLYYQTPNLLHQAGVVAIATKIWRSSVQKNRKKQMWNSIIENGLIHPIPTQEIRGFDSEKKPLISLDYTPEEGLRIFRDFRYEEHLESIKRLEKHDGIEDAVDILQRDLDHELTTYRKRATHLKEEAEGLERKIGIHKRAREEGLENLERRISAIFARLAITEGSGMEIHVSEAFIEQATNDIRRLERNPPPQQVSYDLKDVEVALSLVNKYGFKAKRQQLTRGSSTKGSLQEISVALEEAKGNAPVRDERLFKIYLNVAEWARKKYHNNSVKAKMANSNEVDREKEAKRFKRWQNRQHSREYRDAVKEHRRYESEYQHLKQDLETLTRDGSSLTARARVAKQLVSSGLIRADRIFVEQDVAAGIEKMLRQVDKFEKLISENEGLLRSLPKNPEKYQALPAKIKEYANLIRSFVGKDPEARSPFPAPYLGMAENVEKLLKRAHYESRIARRAARGYQHQVEEIEEEHGRLENQLKSTRRQSLRSAQQAEEYEGRLQEIQSLRERIDAEGGFSSEHMAAARKLMNGENPYEELQRRQLKEKKKRGRDWKHKLDLSRATFSSAHAVAISNVEYEVRSGPIRRVILDLHPGEKLYQVDLVPVIQLSPEILTSSQPSAR